MADRRKPWLAGLLNLVGGSGLGHLYNGRPVKAALFLLGPPVLGAALFIAVHSGRFSALRVLGAFALLLAVQVFSVVDGVLDARRLGDSPRPWYSRWWALALAYVVLLVFLPLWSLAVLRTSVQAFRIPTGGMEPTLLRGDHLLADRRAYGARLPFIDRPLSGPPTPRRGDVAVFLYPEDPERMFIQRVIGLPGETVEIRHRVVYIDGRPLDEHYVQFLSLPPVDPADEEQDGRDNWGPETIPTQRLFMLGDNRDNSRDSRYWGFLPVENLRGRATLVYYSTDERAGRVRWDRIGHVVR